MDATVNDFLNEINEIVPPVKKLDCDWQECFDEGTGFPYYWNVNSNEVTWEMPPQYREWLESGKGVAKKVSTPPPKIEPLFPGVSLNTAPSSVKIYKIQEDTKNVFLARRKMNEEERKKKIKPPRKKSVDSEDEKIILISSYGEDSESEEEETVTKKETTPHSSLPNSPNASSNCQTNSRASSEAEDEANNLVPVESNHAAELTTCKDDLVTTKSTGFALVAGYGDDSDEEEEHEDRSNVVEEVVSHSTLFPVTKPIDISQFVETKPVEKPAEPEDIDTKAFQRKRRIAISLVNVPRRQRLDEGEHKGLGFKNDNASNTGVAVSFVKSDTLYPSNDVGNDLAQNDSNKNVDEVQATLKEKLVFLSEGKEAPSPVQIMLIQLETLYEALKSGSLDSGYLTKWITETCEGLVKLEEDAAPNGWLLQWDRIHQYFPKKLSFCYYAKQFLSIRSGMNRANNTRSQKRYYYRNKMTGECQWEYPPAIEDDAMDICTTPPPPVESSIDEEPMKATGRTKTPPPVIAVSINLDSLMKKDVVVSSLQQATEIVPPGTEDSIVTKIPPSSDLSSVLDSFYSDIAAIENTNPLVNSVKDCEQNDLLLKNVITASVTTELPKKKKKIKMTTGISMKKKGVSKLVEKWKNVQKDLD